MSDKCPQRNYPPKIHPLRSHQQNQIETVHPNRNADKTDQNLFHHGSLTRQHQFHLASQTNEPFAGQQYLDKLHDRHWAIAFDIPDQTCLNELTLLHLRHQRQL